MPLTLHKKFMVTYLKIDWQEKDVWIKVDTETKKCLWVDKKSILIMDGIPILPSNQSYSITKEEFHLKIDEIFQKINDF